MSGMEVSAVTSYPEETVLCHQSSLFVCLSVIHDSYTPEHVFLGTIQLIHLADTVAAIVIHAMHDSSNRISSQYTSLD